MGKTRMRGCAIALFTALFVAAAAADQIADIISQATLPEYQSYLRVLTGVDPVPGNPPVYLTNRYALGHQIRIAGQWMREELASCGLDTSLHTFDTAWGSNVIGELRGTTRPEDVYVICAHYDTYCEENQSDAPGCDDNGSGTAAVLLAARILSQYQFEGTIRFVAFSGEEQWMVGSNAYVAEAKMARENIVAAINLDMILHPSFDNDPTNLTRTLNIEKDTADSSTWLAQYMQGKFNAYTALDTRVGTDPYGAGDHGAFWNYGYSAIDLIEHSADEIWSGDVMAEYHHATDNYFNPHLDWDFGIQTVRGGMAGLIGLAGLVPEPGTFSLVAVIVLCLGRRSGRA